MIAQGDNCKDIFYRTLPQFNVEINDPFYPYHNIPSTEISRMEFLVCGSQLAQDGDTVAEHKIIDVFELLYRSLENKKSKIKPSTIYIYLGPVLGRLNNKEAFSLGMLFFGKNICATDFLEPPNTLGDLPNDNYGLGAFQSVILPMITAEQNEYYRRLYNKEFEKYIFSLKDEEDSGFKLFHQQFYPIIEKDWKEGKIKLRNDG